MNFGLLWLDALVISLLWVGALAACVGRVKRRWMRGLFYVVAVAVPLLPLGMFVSLATAMKFDANMEPNWFGYALSLLLAYLAGTSFILRRAGRRQLGLPPNAATWRRGPLAFAWLTAVVVGYITLSVMDLAIRARSAILDVKINSVYLATLPAITSEAQNAAPIYEKAFAQLRDDHEAEEAVQNPPTGNRDNFDPAEPATIAFLSKEAGTMALLRRAAAMPACRFDEDLLDPDINAILLFGDEERNAANVLNLHAREEIAHGHVLPAIADAAAILRMSRHFAQRQMIISALVGIGVDGIGNKTLEDALPEVKNGNELSTLRLDELPSLGRMFQQALRGEERFGVVLYGNWSISESKMTQGRAAQFQDTAMMGLTGTGLEGSFCRAFLIDLDAYVELMRDLQDSATQPYYKVHGKVSQVFGLGHSGGLLISLLGPSLSRSFQTLAYGEATDACAQTAVAMTRYRLDRGKFPARLDDLVPAYLDAVPIDPFDGHPLRLAVRNNQWIIYSIGPDGIDNGGTEMVKGKGDIIFTLKSVSTAATTK